MQGFSKKRINYTIFGNLLGDGYYNSGRLYVTASSNHADYIIMLRDLYSSFGIEVNYRGCYERKSTFGVQKISSINFLVPDRRHFENGRFRVQNYRRFVSKYILDRITPLGIFLWYLDDGNLSVCSRKDGKKTSRFAYLNTHAFYHEDQIKIQNMFFSRFGIETSLHKDRSGFDKSKEYERIYINSTNFKKLFDLCEEYLPLLPESMKLKFNMKFEENSKNFDQLKKYNL